MTAVLLPHSCTTSAIHNHYHHNTARTLRARHTTIDIRSRHSFANEAGGGGAGGDRREPLGELNRNMPPKRQVNGSSATGKRKAVEYEEDIEGFQFSRAGQVKRSRSSDKGTDAESSAEETPLPQPVAKPRGKGRPPKNATSPKKTAATAPTNGKSTQATLVHRRSKRRAEDEGSTTPPAKQSKSRGQLDDSRPATINIPKKRGPRRKSADADTQQPEAEDNETPATHTRHAATKVALPLADTPVIRRNREMRQEKSKKGQRRSSLSMRGRRASSLIESGASNALPHDAVDSAHFYKHIEGDGLPEPRRMKQLLTWCATRALGEKPSGSRSEDESARLAARVIQEELLKDLGNRSELSDWFGRRETTPPAVVVKKPNPKNVQNAQKLKELEAQIRRLQEERQSLAALLNTPSMPSLASLASTTSKSQKASSPHPTLRSGVESIDSSLLDPSQQLLLAALTGSSAASQQPPSRLPRKRKSQAQTEPIPESIPEPAISTSLTAVSSRLSSLSLTPSLDSLAAGIHDIELFRRSADRLAGSVLGICARRLEERDLRLRSRSPLDREADRPPDETSGHEAEYEDLSVVLGALSRLERR